MIRLPDQPDDALRSQFGSFDYASSTTIGQSHAMPGFSLHRCAIRGIANAVGLWTGLWVGPDGEYGAYLALKPIAYGNIAGFEAFRAWTDPCFRRRGLAAELLTCAVRQCGPIITDREGMTQGAFHLWHKVGQSGAVTLDYLDAEHGRIVPQQPIPADDLFSPWPNSDRWQILLRP